jgi:hypothetical protein
VLEPLDDPEPPLLEELPAIPLLEPPPDELPAAPLLDPPLDAPLLDPLVDWLPPVVPLFEVQPHAPLAIATVAASSPREIVRYRNVDRIAYHYSKRRPLLASGKTPLIISTLDDHRSGRFFQD